MCESTESLDVLAEFIDWLEDGSSSLGTLVLAGMISWPSL
jgi:hypothetical protein